MMEQVWIELKGKDELVNCQVCGKRIWKFWKQGTEEMDKCAPCLFSNKVARLE